MTRNLNKIEKLKFFILCNNERKQFEKVVHWDGDTNAMFILYKSKLCMVQLPFGNYAWCNYRLVGLCAMKSNLKG